VSPGVRTPDFESIFGIAQQSKRLTMMVNAEFI
jgi:hypothetical protein